MDYTKMNEDEIKSWLKENLSEKRYIHSLGTANCAKNLAKNFDLNIEKAYIAGLLHDCAKCFDKEKLMEIIKENLNIDENEMLNHKTLHAPVSAYYAETVFGINDIEILNAIKFHTLGRINMTDFEKVIFLADKIEPNTRDEDFRKLILEVLNEEYGLDKALFICYKETIKSLVKRELKICPVTIDIYNNLLSKLNTIVNNK